MRRIMIWCSVIFFGNPATAQAAEDWVATLQRTDGERIVFNFRLEKKNGATEFVVVNAPEQIRVGQIRLTKDSVIIQMPVFESVIHAAIEKDGWQGTWTKGGTVREHVMPFRAKKSGEKFPATEGDAVRNISGRWAVHLANDESADYPAVAEFRQQGNKLSGTILTPTGDYRYLSGIVTGNKIRLSTFDGSHAFLFTATIAGREKITDGKFFSGLNYVEDWYAKKDRKASVNSQAVSMAMQPGEERLGFTFPDLDRKQVSISDGRFKNKVVIVQIMGSWCPNCMDETAFLSNYYNLNRERGVEVVSLAYEYSTDFERSAKSLKKFRDRFHVQYPMLITGVSVADSLRTEKTLPQVTPIKFFPSSIIIDKKGIVRKFDTGFVGPGTGKHFEAYTKRFYALMEELLNEK